MDKDQIRADAIRVVEALEDERSYILPHFVTLRTLTLALADLGKQSPIDGEDPITTSLAREINRLCPGLSVVDAMLVRAEITKIVSGPGFADRYFDIQNI